MESSAMVAVGVAHGLLLLTGVVVGSVLWVRIGRLSRRWDARAHRISLRPILGRDALLLVALVFGFVSLAVVGMQAAGMSEGEMMTSRGVVIQSFAFHWAVLVLAMLILKGRRTRWRRVFGMFTGRLGGDLRRGVVAYFAMVPVVFVFAMVYKLMLYVLGFEVDVQEVAKILTEDAHVVVRFYLFALAVVLAPIAEEILFRGMLFPVLARRLGPFGAMMAVSLIFALIHFHVPSFLPLFVVSMAFCLGYIYTGSLAVPMVMHALFNGVNLALFTIMQGTG